MADAIEKLFRLGLWLDVEFLLKHPLAGLILLKRKADLPFRRVMFPQRTMRRLMQWIEREKSLSRRSRHVIGLIAQPMFQQSGASLDREAVQ
jgi:hypothetical protein